MIGEAETETEPGRKAETAVQRTETADRERYGRTINRSRSSRSISRPLGARTGARMINREDGARMAETDDQSSGLVLVSIVLVIDGARGLDHSEQRRPIRSGLSLTSCRHTSGLDPIKAETESGSSVLVLDPEDRTRQAESPERTDRRSIPTDSINFRTIDQVVIPDHRSHDIDQLDHSDRRVNGPDPLED